MARNEDIVKRISRKSVDLMDFFVICDIIESKENILYNNSDKQSVPKSISTVSKPSISIIVADKKSPTKHSPSKKNAYKPKNIFADETARYLLRLVRGKSRLPDKIVLPKGIKEPEQTDNTEQKQDVQEELAAAIREILLPWLWSFVFHAGLLILFALLFFPKLENDLLTIISGIDEIPTNLTIDFPLGIDNSKIELPTLIVPQELPPVEMPKVAPPKVEATDISNPVTATEDTSEAPPGFSINGREIGSRANVLGKGGGTGQTDEAVVMALRWLVRVQSANGYWSLSGPYRDAAPRNRDNRNAATAMALLAFQGYGVTPNTKHPQLTEFAKSVRIGWDWLLLQQNREDRENGCFFRKDEAYSDPDQQRFYTHGLCTIALCELLAMTNDQTFREPAQRAVDYCLKHQSIEGGWRYLPDRFRSGSDVSVTGWIVLALRTAEAAGLSVPPETYGKVAKYFDSVSRDGGSQYIYREQEPEFRISMTAEALFCRELLGWKRNNKRLEQGVRLLIQPEHLPTFEEHYKRDVYYWFYATQALRNYGGEPWEIWNTRMRELLVQHQEKTGTNAGSWNPNVPVQDKWGTHYGRLYTTCLSVYILETYYRITLSFEPPSE